MSPDHKAALARAQKMVATPRMFKAENLNLAAAYLELTAKLAEVEQRELALMNDKDAGAQPCCTEWDICTRRCAPLAENWRMWAKRLESHIAEVEQATIERCARMWLSAEICETAIAALTNEPPATQDRPCTCHPDDNPPVPCQKKYALSECRAAAAPDEDGHCAVCGLKWPDERETLEPHECPPGFRAETARRKP